MNFEFLVNSIQQTHTALQQSAVKAINRHITIRNWLIGFYIFEYEQKGEDRAAYGENLLQNLSERLDNKGLSYRNLKLFRQFYQTYPQIRQTLSAQLQQMGFEAQKIGQSLIAQLMLPQIRQSATDELHNIDMKVPPDKLIGRLSFSHFAEMFEIKEPLKRTFYELECIKGNWSVRELRRQINSLYFERSGLSKNPNKLSAMIDENAESLHPTDAIKSVYAFEFLGLKAKDVIEECDLETALLDHLQDFLIEMGLGFCIEGRQKKILVGDEYFFVDLVFYHRILKCHVLLELKMGEFNHINAGQLNIYLNYYKAEVMRSDDNPPIGILLVTNKNDALVQYATAGMDNNLFVSKYLVELPSKQQLENFVKQELKKL